MPTAEAESLIKSDGGTVACKTTTDPRMHECTGTLPFPGFVIPFGILISSVHDSIAVMVISVHTAQSIAPTWISALTEDFGRPNVEARPGTQTSWQWIRVGQMLRVVERKINTKLESSVTLTDGPLLDGLSPPEAKRPDE